MTYCIGMRLQDGLVFASDSRTNAGFDQIATYRKTFVFQNPGERFLALMTAGNLATSQSVVSLLDARSRGDGVHLLNVTSLYDAAVIVGDTLREVMARDSGQKDGNGTDFSSSLILGGQIHGERTRLFNIYPEGNFIEATEETPYLQIGESKYGKPVIDRAISYQSSLATAYQCALISFDSTMKSNLSVGMPLDMLVYRNGRFDGGLAQRIDEHNPYFQQLQSVWTQGIQQLINSLPQPDPGVIPE